MTVKELWKMTTYIGKVSIERYEDSPSHPIVVFKSSIEFGNMILNSDNEYHYLADKKVAYFDFLLDTMRIVLKGEEQ